MILCCESLKMLISFNISEFRFCSDQWNVNVLLSSGHHGSVTVTLFKQNGLKFQIMDNDSIHCTLWLWMLNLSIIYLRLSEKFCFDFLNSYFTKQKKSQYHTNSFIINTFSIFLLFLPKRKQLYSTSLSRKASPVMTPICSF